MLTEFGIVLPLGIHHIRQRLPSILEEGDNGLPGLFKTLLHQLGEHLQELDRQIAKLEHEILLWHRSNEASRRLEAIPGIGPITASALVATIGNARNFNNGRQLAAWLGLVPRQHSSGGKPTLLGISKRGDCYLRTLLVHGARAVVRVVPNRTDPTSTWLSGLLVRRPNNVAAVALANKTVRIVWSVLAHDKTYQPA